MTEEQLTSLKNYIDLRVRWMIDADHGRPLPEEWKLDRLEKQFDAIMLGTQRGGEIAA